MTIPAGSRTAGSSAVERAYAHVADAIISGELAASTLITEGDVAASLALSRTPVREAFLALESAGLLRLFPKKGAVVTAVDDTETTELLQVRILLETKAVQLLGERPTHIDAVDAELRVLIQKQTDAASAGDLLAYARADHRFHSRVVDETHNSVIDEIYSRLGPRLERLVHRVAARDPDSIDRLIAEHRLLADHLRVGDTAAYDQALRAHLESGHRLPRTL
ncbi:GntR family transcriptional regulator [Cryobacterium adonitolivorans]|uniref:GntR family transcriptional regulator n=1 Tax=Cryobacterium adonitolivorans TaxID=1259189 RepID=A0A4V3IDI9_9MICO|nr:GntR family transcriptional regulator [Cryobacterium adonitolivorans]TFC07050.1 GntR family transcriptional regulator [Cryobacterium adonitolivorans]